ncbi:MAG TPA: UbiA family prenyltransferase, partial [Acidobacteriota bacterium]|nr:UbiA family prenyltransferase [Acidobacteriota bacterium]
RRVSARPPVAPGEAPILARALAVLRLYRAVNLAAIAAAAWVGSLLGNAPLDPTLLLVPVLIGAYGYARNDATDAEPDRWNRPGRPIPAGALAPRTVLGLAYLALALAGALLLARAPGLPWVALAAFAAILLTAYSPWLKNRGAAGPAAIALLSVLAVVWGGLGGSAPGRTLLPAMLAGWAQLARECVKQLEDAPGDRAAGRATWAVRAGAARVTAAARIALLGALLVLPLPVSASGLRARYFAVALPAAGLPLLWAFAALGRPAVSYGRVSAAIKGALFAGLAALAWGA